MRSTSMWLCVLGVAGVSLYAANTASAATLLSYDASSGLRPNELPTGAWTRYGANMTLADGKLTQHASDGGVAGASSSEYLSPTLTAGTFTRGGAAYGIEFRVQPFHDIDTVNDGLAWPRAYVTWSDNQFNYNVTLDQFSTGSTTTGGIVYGKNSFTPAISGIDWSAPHTIFIGHRGNGTDSVFDFYLDGVLKSTVTDGSIARTGSFARDAIDFGDGTTGSAAITADWYFVRVHNVNTPAVTPVPEPATLSALGLIGAACLGRRRR